MHLLIGAVGRLKAGPERALTDDYVERAARLCRQAGLASVGVVEVAESAAASAGTRRAEEAHRLLAALPPGAAVIALDERGEDAASEALAALVRRHADAGVSALAFLIGGPDGHGEAVRERAERSLRFGRQTWPHRLVRAMLAEQIYRSVTILLNHPYHRA